MAEGWWRCSKYEIIEGTHIAPTRDAEIEWYDPFDEYDRFWRRRKKDPLGPPYQSLLELDLEDAGAVLRWVRRFGLLGVLPHRLEEACLWPKWDVSAPLLKKGKTVYGVRQDHYRAGLPIKTVKAFDIQPEEEPEIGTLLSSKEASAAWGRESRIFPKIRPPGAALLDVEAGGIEWLDLRDGLDPFFPRSPLVSGTDGPADYPLPFSERFCLEYAEPLDLFRDFAWNLLSSIWHWHGEEDLLPLPTIREPTAFSEMALRGIQPSVRRTEGKGWEFQWNSRSLYAAFSFMILQDHALKGAKLLRCRVCEKAFTTERPDKKYCSSRCQLVDQTRRQRARDKEKKREFEETLERQMKGLLDED